MTATALFEDVLHDLGLAIVRGEIPEGARLTLADIEARYGVSRTLSRDVVKSVEARQNHDMALAIYRATSDVIRASLGRSR